MIKVKQKLKRFLPWYIIGLIIMTWQIGLSWIFFPILGNIGDAIVVIIGAALFGLLAYAGYSVFYGEKE